MREKKRAIVESAFCADHERLTPENVVQAIEEVGPFGLDLCSGVRTDGKLDAAKLKRFFSAVTARL